MKKLISFIIVLIVFNSSLLIHNCQSQWVNYTLPYNGIAYTLGFYDVNTGVSCGHTLMPFNEKLYYTSNSGANWILATCPPEIRALSEVQFINSTTVYACGAENVIKYYTQRFNKDFASLPYYTRQKQLRLGKSENNAEYKGAFLKSTNAGLNWQKAGQFDTLTGYIPDIHFFNAYTGYAIMDSLAYGNTIFYKTTNAGQNWQRIKLIENGAVVNEILFLDINTGFATGHKDTARIYKTTNGGYNWVQNNMPTQIDGITFFNATTGIAIGIKESGGTNIYKTTNAGDNWSTILNVPGLRLFNNLKSVSSTGIAFAAGNKMDSLTFTPDRISTMKTTDYGTTWIVKDFLPSKVIYGLALIDQNNFYIGGGDYDLPACILKSTNGGNVFVNNISSEIPSAYSLEQNYPNPFNPTTNVQFSIIGYPPGHVQYVTLKIFDMLGKEISTLVNEKLAPGTYTVDWNASQYPSGVYFYRLQTDGYSETRKMLLTK